MGWDLSSCLAVGRWAQLLSTLLAMAAHGYLTLQIHRKKLGLTKETVFLEFLVCLSHGHSLSGIAPNANTRNQGLYHVWLLHLRPCPPTKNPSQKTMLDEWFHYLRCCLSHGFACGSQHACPCWSPRALQRHHTPRLFVPSFLHLSLLIYLTVSLLQSNLVTPRINPTMASPRSASATKTPVVAASSTTSAASSASTMSLPMASCTCQCRYCPLF
jgi:hypothetical protein